jgi:hypothetical protein
MKNRLCLILLAPALANTCSSAAETAAPAPTATASPTPTPILLPDIVAEAVSAKRVLAAMRSALAPSQTKTTTLRGLPDLEYQIDARAIESTTIVATGPSFAALDELLDDWENLAAESTSWSLHLTQRVTELEADATRLDRPQKQAWAVRLRVCFGSKGRSLFSRNGWETKNG